MSTARLSYLIGNEALTVKRQCELVNVNRNSVYRKQTQERDNPGHGESLENLELMTPVDQTHLKIPVLGLPQDD